MVARVARGAERKAALLASEARDVAQQAAREVARQAEIADRDAKVTEQAAREITLQPERKGAGDARYAARKLRK